MGYVITCEDYMDFPWCLRYWQFANCLHLGRGYLKANSSTTGPGYHSWCNEIHIFQSGQNYFSDFQHKFHMVTMTFLMYRKYQYIFKKYSMTYQSKTLCGMKHLPLSGWPLSHCLSKKALPNMQTSSMAYHVQVVVKTRKTFFYKLCSQYLMLCICDWIL